MRRFRDIIEDIKAPSIQNLWLNGGKLKYYGENGWQDIKGQDASTSVRGGVLMAAAVADLAGTEDAAAICIKVNALLSALRASGALQS